MPRSFHVTYPSGYLSLGGSTPTPRIQSSVCDLGLQYRKKGMSHLISKCSSSQSKTGTVTMTMYLHSRTPVVVKICESC